MNPLAAGAAFLDASGAIVAADGGFRALLGLGDGDAREALRARADADPALRALVAGEGEPSAAVAGADGVPLVLERVAGPGGALVTARLATLGEALEHAMRSLALGRVANGVSHDIRNPLNAMALQIALLGDKISASPEASAAAASHLAALREQVTRVNEVLRRFVEVAEPSAPPGEADVGSLVGDAAALLGHDARKRRVQLAVDAPRGALRTGGDPEGVARILLGILGRALAETPDGGRLAVRAEASGHGIAIRIEHAVGDPDGAAGYYRGAAVAGARRLGGALTEERREGVARITLALPGNER